MTYAKTPLSLEAQADLLLDRGLIADRGALIVRLQAVNYYRLSGYLHPYRMRDAKGDLTDDYQPEVPLSKMGLPENWREHALFRVNE